MSNTFVHPYDIPTDPAERSRLLDRMHAYRKDARPEAVDSFRLGAQYEGEPEILYADSAVPSVCDPPLCRHFQWPAPRPHAVEPDLIGPGARLHVIRPLAVGPSQNAQVYIASIEPGSTFVVKVYQGSMINLEYDMLHPGGPDKYWTGMFRQYAEEYWAYDRMRGLQGVVVPHVYGFFKVTLPHGEPAVALVMEHIRNDFDRMPLQLASDKSEALPGAYLGVVAAVHAITNCGVLHEDVKPRNVLWSLETAYSTTIHGTDYAGHLPVFIDFANSSRSVNYFEELWFLSKAIGLLTGFHVKLEACNDLTRAFFTCPQSDLLEPFNIPEPLDPLDLQMLMVKHAVIPS